MSDDTKARPQADPATSGVLSDDNQIGSLFVSNYPPFSFWNEEAGGEMLYALNNPPNPSTPLGLYLHIPFCRKRCKFCYFRVYTDKNADQISTYTEALAREVELYSELASIGDRKLKYVYIGGGTPSYIAVKHLEALIHRVRAALPWDEVEEVAFECEPGTLTEAKLHAIRELGITRLSLGIENFDDEILRENGRAHVSKEIYRVWPWIKALDFDQVNVDLIAGMIGETWDTWRQTVRKTIDFGADSVTIYQLELPHNTRYTKIIQGGEVELPVADWATKRAWQDYAFNELIANGYELSSAYTVVRSDKRAKFVYRDNVWSGSDMLGTGIASFGHMSGVHLQNEAGWEQYLQAIGEDRLPLKRGFATSADDRLVREFILQLKRGHLGNQYFVDKFGVDAFAEFAREIAWLEEQGMLTTSDGSIELTRDGLLRADTLLPTFYREHYRNARYT